MHALKYQGCAVFYGQRRLPAMLSRLQAAAVHTDTPIDHGVLVHSFPEISFNVADQTRVRSAGNITVMSR